MKQIVERAYIGEMVDADGIWAVHQYADGSIQRSSYGMALRYTDLDAFMQVVSVFGGRFLANNNFYKLSLDKW